VPSSRRCARCSRPRAPVQGASREGKGPAGIRRGLRSCCAGAAGAGFSARCCRRS
jgi:hypothetical protein